MARHAPEPTEEALAAREADKVHATEVRFRVIGPRKVWDCEHGQEGVKLATPGEVNALVAGGHIEVLPAEDPEEEQAEETTLDTYVTTAETATEAEGPTITRRGRR